jgi:hypothetical protein
MDAMRIKPSGIHSRSTPSSLDTCRVAFSQSGMCFISDILKNAVADIPPAPAPWV